jgi:hypothetical protein
VVNLPATAVEGTIDWTDVPKREQKVVMELLDSPDWPFRVMGLLRLERYKGDEPAARVTALVSDRAWQVRCFALRQADRMGVSVPGELLAAEAEARVVRAALRHGVRLSDETVERGAMRLLQTRGLDELMLGLEIAAVCDIEAVREDAASRAERLIKRMDDTVAIRIRRRLARTLGVDPVPPDAEAWRAWLASRDGKVDYPKSGSGRGQGGGAITGGSAPEPNIIAQLEPVQFMQLIEYFDALRQRHLNVAVVMDTTMSMMPMINESRAAVDAVILFLRDISRSMRLAFVAYRDHDNEPVWEGQALTDDIESVRRFLFGLRVTGGADYPEAVLEGVRACEKLRWNRDADRQIIIVGDAPPHERDEYDLARLLESFHYRGITVHTAHVPMERAEGFYLRMTMAQEDRDRAWMRRYNETTAQKFRDMAELGGGKAVQMHEVDDLVPSIMRFTIQEAWWPVFDAFYSVYLELCR